jgi:hypothetical protein
MINGILPIVVLYRNTIIIAYLEMPSEVCGANLPDPRVNFVTH